METTIAIIAIILAVAGIIGSILPALPGPPLAWVGMLFVYLWGGGTKGGEPMSLKLLLIMLAVTVVVSILDYLVPGYLTRKTGGSKAGSRGAIVGLLVGMFVMPPWGILIGTMAGAFAAELIVSGRDTTASLKSAFGAFLGFISGTGIKLIASCMMLWYIIAYGF
ncbi:MAG: DUF456 domain-containing protein [Bacteroidales bacterium]|jgi:uncharacterized protein YqgC (DUF456 family)|nr:DUF456 domain-containing protein [Bacteroidales bacterium]